MPKTIAGILTIFLAFASFCPVLAGDWTPHGFFYKPSLGARGALEKSKYDSGLDRVDERLNKEIWVGDPNYGTTIPAVVTAIGSTQAILRVPAGTYNIGSLLTIPGNITLKPERGASLHVTIPDVDIAGLSQANPCVVTWTGHGLSTGDKVSFSGITQDGWKGLNGCNYSITKIGDNSFSIPINTADAGVFPAAYVPATDPGKISKVLDVRGGIEAGEYQIFSANPGKVVIGSGKVAKILPQWWGAVADGSTDSASAIQAAFFALPTGYGGRIHFCNGIYYLASSVVPCNFTYFTDTASPMTVYITGDNATLYTDQAISILKRWPSEAMSNAFAFAAYAVDGLRFKGTSNRLQVGLDLGGTYGSRITNCRFEKLGRGLRLTYALMPVVENCLADQCVVAGYSAHDGYGLWSDLHDWATNYVKYQNCRNYGATATPIDIEGMTRANPCVVTWTGHGLATGDVIFINGITQADWTALNHRRFKITKIGDNSFSLYLMNGTTAIDTSGYAGAYVPATDPGKIQAAVFGFELINTYGVTLDSCIAEGGNLTDNIFFYSPAPATNFFAWNFYSENTPYGSNLYLNFQGGSIQLNKFGSIYGDVSIDAYDTSHTAIGVVSLIDYITSGSGGQKIRLPEDSNNGSLHWIFNTAGTLGRGFDMFDPGYWYGGVVPLWMVENYPRDGMGPKLVGGWLELQGSYGVFINQEPRNGGAVFPGASYHGLKSQANALGGGGVGAYDSSNSQAIMIRQKAAEITITASGTDTQTVSNFIPAGVMVVGFSARVTTAIGGATSFGVQDQAGTPVKWLTGVGVALNSTGALAQSDATTASLPKTYQSASNINIKAAGGNFNGTGKVRLTCHYIVLEAPGS